MFVKYLKWSIKQIVTSLGKKINIFIFAQMELSDIYAASTYISFQGAKYCWKNMFDTSNNKLWRKYDFMVLHTQLFTVNERRNKFQDK